jgi:hypothetical protein
MVDSFVLTFSFEDDSPFLNMALETIRDRILRAAPSPVSEQPDWARQIEHALECYNLAVADRTCFGML